VGFRVARKFTGTSTGIKTGETLSSGPSGLRNFPNPFQSATTISFDLVKPENVTLTIYDSLGQLVATLVNRQLTNGPHHYQWNAGQYPPGIYSCRLQADDQLYINRMVLIK
jgi:flagellar hook assembly protein FlgD